MKVFAKGGHYRLVEYTSGTSTRTATRNTLAEISKEARRVVADAARYDGINYIVRKDVKGWVRKANPSSVAPFGTKWDGEKARQRLRRFTADMTRAQKQAVFEKAFAMWPKRGQTRSNLDNYKLPVLDVKRGKLILVPKAVSSAKGYLHGARGVKMEATAAQKRDAEKRLRALDRRIK